MITILTLIIIFYIQLEQNYLFLKHTYVLYARSVIVTSRCFAKLIHESNRIMISLMKLKIVNFMLKPIRASMISRNRISQDHINLSIYECSWLVIECFNIIISLRGSDQRLSQDENSLEYITISSKVLISESKV